MYQEFLDFIIKYNIFGVAIGLIVAAKVNELVKTIVEDLFMPAIFHPLMKKMKVDKLEELSFKGILYGKVIATFIDFIIIAFIVFLFIKYSGISL